MSLFDRIDPSQSINMKKSWPGKKGDAAFTKGCPGCVAFHAEFRRTRERKVTWLPKFLGWIWNYQIFVTMGIQSNAPGAPLIIHYCIFCLRLRYESDVALSSLITSLMASCNTETQLREVRSVFLSIRLLSVYRKTSKNLTLTFELFFHNFFTWRHEELSGTEFEV